MGDDRSVAVASLYKFGRSQSFATRPVHLYSTNPNHASYHRKAAQEARTRPLSCIGSWNSSFIRLLVRGCSPKRATPEQPAHHSLVTGTASGCHQVCLASGRIFKVTSFAHDLAFKPSSPRGGLLHQVRRRARESQLRISSTATGGVIIIL